MGNVFSPLHNDIARNIEKVKESYDTNPSLYECIEDLILNKKSEGDEIPLEALLWLKRFVRINNENTNKPQVNCNYYYAKIHYINSITHREKTNSNFWRN